MRPSLLSPLLAATLFAGAAFPAATKDFQKNVPIRDNDKIDVRTERGTVRVSSWDRSEVDIKARIEAQREDPNPDESVRRVEIRVEPSAGSVRIYTDYGERISDWKGNHYTPRVHYEVRVPRKANLVLQDSRSEVTLQEIAGKLDLNLDRSEARLDGFNGRLSVQSDRGRLDVNHLKLTDSSQITMDRTDLTVSLSSGVNLDLSLDRVTPNIDRNLLSGALDQGRRSVAYRGAVAGGGVSLRISGDRGQLRLRRA